MDRIKLNVLGLSYSMSQNGAYALILVDEQDIHRVPIIIGIPEAQSIAIQLEKLHTQRPLSHDLIKALADILNTTLKEVFIYKLDSGIFYSELLFETAEKQIRLDSRTSDAIALALRYNCPIYTTPEIIEKAGIVVSQDIAQHEKHEKLPPEIVNVEEKYKEYTTAELTKLLHEAIENEEYEKASKLRDFLKNKK